MRRCHADFFPPDQRSKRQASTAIGWPGYWRTGASRSVERPRTIPVRRAPRAARDSRPLYSLTLHLNMVNQKKVTTSFLGMAWATHTGWEISSTPDKEVVGMAAAVGAGIGVSAAGTEFGDVTLKEEGYGLSGGTVESYHERMQRADGGSTCV